MSNRKKCLEVDVLLSAYVYSYIVMVVAVFFNNYIYSHKYIFNDRLIPPYYESYSNISLEGLLYTFLSPIVFFLFPLIGSFRVQLYFLWFVLPTYCIFKIIRAKDSSFLMKKILLIVVFLLWNMIGLDVIKN